MLDDSYHWKWAKLVLTRHTKACVRLDSDKKLIIHQYYCCSRQNFELCFYAKDEQVIIKVDSIFVVTEHVLWLFRFVHGSRCCLFVIINESSGALKMNFVQRIIHQIKDCLVQLVND